MNEIEKKRRIGVVTTSRADYSHLYWPLRELSAHPSVDLAVFALGAHLSPEFGGTLKEIERDGFPIQARIECLLSSDTDTGMAKTIGLAMLGLADALTAWRPDILLLIADRYEMLAPASVALAMRIPIAHIEGGEISQGAIDDHVRNALTKLAAIHFTSTPAARRRVIAMGEEPWRVHHAGAPSLDHLSRSALLDRAALEARLGLRLASPTILAAWHPVTILDDANAEADAFFAALAAAPGQLIFVYPNADAGSHALIERTRALAASRPFTSVYVNLDAIAYWSLLAHVNCLAGNSSSGIMEAASFALPVVNVGIRQQGRERAINTIDVPAEPTAIGAAIHRAFSPEFRATLAAMANPYGNGTAAKTIAHVLTTVALEGLLIKQPAPLPGDEPLPDPVPVQIPAQLVPTLTASRPVTVPALPDRTQPALELVVDPHGMSRSRQGTIFGPISFNIAGQPFPAAGYTDLAVAFICVWLDSVVKVLTGKKNHVRVRYYHNPYSVDVSAAEKGAADLEFIWHAIGGDQLIAALPVRLHELTKESMAAGESILKVCNERDWVDPDIQHLTEILKDARKALRKAPGAAVPAQLERK
jgi:UDP-N-acetylglucosamine 2-epimerase (non-hydrolysing)/GDP/UDP-N,N'-diacetylbacillosamine 2-epimerase (hydrolysing)